MPFKTMLTIGLGWLGLTMSVPAHATLYNYELRLDETPIKWTWTLDDSVVPAIHDPAFVRYVSVAGSFPGYGAEPVQTFSVAEICFFTDTFIDPTTSEIVFVGGGLEIDENGNDTIHYVGTSIPKLYGEEGGIVSLKTGTFNMIRYDFDTGDDPSVTFTLDVSAVPEPATWTMLLLGFGMIGGTMRRRQVIAKFIDHKTLAGGRDAA